MAITVVCGRQAVTIVECPEGSIDDDQTAYVGNIGRGSPELPVNVRLSDSPSLSRRAAQVRCVDGSWWQVRQVGANGLSLTTSRGAFLPITTEWTDVPARFGTSYVTVTAFDEVFEFKVEPIATASPAHGPSDVGHLDVSEDISTNVVPKVGYWRVAVAICEPMLWDRSERVPSTPEIARRLDTFGLEAEGFTERAVEKRIKHLYDITGVEPGDRVGLRRRLIDSLVVTKDDVAELFLKSRDSPA